MIDAKFELYNPFDCLELSKQEQIAVNNIAVYLTELYIEYWLSPVTSFDDSLVSGGLDENYDDNISKNYACYALKLISNGIHPTLLSLMNQNYYESKMFDLSASNLLRERLSRVRLQMLFVMYAVPLLQKNEKAEYLSFAEQLVSNSLDFEKYRFGLNIQY